MANLDKLFTVADLDVKRSIIGSTFPEKLIYEKNAYRTASDENILLLLAATAKGSNQKKESRQENSYLLSAWVDSPDKMSNQLKQIFRSIYPLKANMGNTLASARKL